MPGNTSDKCPYKRQAVSIQFVYNDDDSFVGTANGLKAASSADNETRRKITSQNSNQTCNHQSRYTNNGPLTKYTNLANNTSNLWITASKHMHKQEWHVATIIIRN